MLIVPAEGLADGPLAGHEGHAGRGLVAHPQHEGHRAAVIVELHRLARARPRAAASSGWSTHSGGPAFLRSEATPEKAVCAWK